MLMVGLAFIKIKSLSIRGPQTNGEEVFPQKCSLSMEEIKRGKLHRNFVLSRFNVKSVS